MITNFTFNDLLLFHYKELPQEKADEIALALEFDSELQEEYETILNTTDFLDTAKQKPSTFSLNYILDYSKNANGELELI